MRLLGLTLATVMVLAAAGESKAQVMIGNPYSGGLFIGGGGISIGNGFGYSGYGMPVYGAYGVPGTSFYSSRYVAPGLAAPYGLRQLPRLLGDQLHLPLLRLSVVWIRLPTSLPARPVRPALLSLVVKSAFRRIIPPVFASPITEHCLIGEAKKFDGFESAA